MAAKTSKISDYLQVYDAKIRPERGVIIKIAVLILLFFGINIYFQFATDTFPTLQLGFIDRASDMFSRNGRPLIALIYGAWGILHLPSHLFYYFSSASALVLLGGAVWLLQKILQRYNLKENTRILLAFTAIANIYILEYFMFIEKVGFMLAIFLCILSLYFIEQFFREHRLKQLVLAVAMLVLTILTYQCAVALFVILSIPFAFKHAKKLKDYILNILSIGACYGFAVLVDLLAFKTIFASQRIGENTNLFQNFKNVLKVLPSNLITTFNILPRGLFAIILAVLFITTIILACRHKNKVAQIVNIFIIVGVALIFSVATIIQGSSGWTPRVVYPLASVVSVLAINLFVNLSLKHNQCSKKCHKIAFALLGIILIFQYVSFNKINIDKYQLNVLDQYRYQFIGQAISEYEESTDNKITQIAFYYDASVSYPQYAGLYLGGDMVVSDFNTGWSDATALNYYLNTDYVRSAQAPEYVEYFAGKDWTTLSQDQLIFDGDTLHICVY